MDLVILGTEYASEMKKDVFSVMVCFCDTFLVIFPSYHLSSITQPIKFGQLPLHSFCQCRHSEGWCYPLFQTLQYWQDYTLHWPWLSSHPSVMTNMSDPISVLEEVHPLQHRHSHDWFQTNVIKHIQTHYMIQNVEMREVMETRAH